MYQQYFGLSETPFSISPNPRYLFLSDKHREALAHLIYGVGDQGGFVLLTGEVGTGKTTICRCLLQQIPDNADVAFIINPKQSINQLLQSIFKDLGIDYQPGLTSKDLIDRLNDYLLDAHSRGRNTILIIDEAQNLSTDVLEQLRLLTNLETNEKKLLQLVLLGQPELNTLLEREDLRQLAQRVTARYHLAPLSKSEVSEYIEYRLSVAGCRSEIFSKTAIQKIYNLSKGVPRLINLICDRALLGVYSTNASQVTPAIVANAAKEVFPRPEKSRWRPVWLAVLLASLILFAGFGIKKYNSSPKAVSPLAVTSTINRQPAVADWITRLESQNSPEKTFVSLYAMWHDVAGPIEKCQQASQSNYQIYCVQSQKSISELLNYNTPLVLAVALEHSGQGYLLVKSASGTQLTIDVGGSEYRIDRDELNGVSLVHSYFLSRAPSSYQLPIEPGDAGREILWLQSLLYSYAQRQELDSAEFDFGMPVKGVSVVDIDNEVANSKMAILYSHRLDFSSAASAQTYSVELQQVVKSVQEVLGFVPSAIVDIAFIAAINHRINQSDPVLFKRARFDGSTAKPLLSSQRSF